MNISNIWWYGDTYSIMMQNAKTGVQAITLLYDTKETYDRVLSRQFDMSFLEDNPTAVQSLGERNDTIYKWRDQGTDFWVKIYTVEQNNVTLHIYESYRGKDTNTKDPPIQLVEVYGEYQGAFFSVTLTQLTSRPTMDELKAFGIREYVETVTE